MSTEVAVEDRQRVLAQHRNLRAILRVVEDAATRVQAREPGAITALRDAIRDLDTSFRAHLAFEESLLLPVLPAEAVARLQTEHGEQRAMLAALSSDMELGCHDAATLADNALWLVRSLLRDMQLEDRAVETNTLGAHS